MPVDSLERFFHHPNEPIGEWLRAFPEVGERGATAPADAREYLVVRLGAESFGIPVAVVRELRPVPPLTSVPRGPEGVAGVMTLRGEMVPVYEVRSRLRVSVGAGSKRLARVVVLRDARGDAGVLVDAVVGVVRFVTSQVEPPLQLGPWAVGIGRMAGTLVVLLDMERLLP